MANSRDLVIAIALTGGAGVMAFVDAIRRRHRYQQIVETVRSNIASARAGLAEFSGWAWPLGGVVRDHRGHLAAYRWLRLEKWVERWNGTRRTGSWQKVFERASPGSFLLIDESGFAQVDLNSSAREFIEHTLEWTALPEALRPHVLEFINTKVANFPPTEGGVLGSARFRVRESVLRAGSPVYARGNFEPGKGSVRALSGLEAFATQARAQGRTADLRQAMMLERDAEASADEHVERDTSSRAAGAAWAAATGAGAAPSEAVVTVGTIATGSGHELFLADCFEPHLVRKYSRWTRGLFVIGTLLMAASIALIFFGRHI